MHDSMQLVLYKRLFYLLYWPLVRNQWLIFPQYSMNNRNRSETIEDDVLSHCSRLKSVMCGFHGKS